MTEPLNLRTDVVRQHTVPRFLLKHFSKPVKGKRQRLHAFDKAAGRAYATTPDDATVRNTAKWHLNRSQFGIRIDHDLASISDHSLASQSITIWHASDH
ncbi:TPA: hypothetical protein MG630_18910 [Klebsiella pneumoniae]|nr:hypothetical protein [Klebsiella pneumoniae]